MKHAIFETGGKQFRVAEGDVVFIEKLDAGEGDTVTFDRVLAVVDENDSTFGTPVVEGAVISATVLKNGKSKKIRVYKMKPKKNYQRTQGHRQPYTKIQIDSIGDAKKRAPRKTTKKTTAEETAPIEAAVAAEAPASAE